MKSISPSTLGAINGSVITVQSLRDTAQNNLLAANGSRSARFRGIQLSRMLSTDADPARLRLHHIPGTNEVLLESTLYPDHYLDMNTRFVLGAQHVVQFTRSNGRPYNRSWARFALWGNDLSNIGIQSTRWRDRWLDAYHTGRAVGTRSAINQLPPLWGRFRLSPPVAPTETMQPLRTITNNTDSTRVNTVTITTGLSISETRENTIGLRVSYESERNLKTKRVASGSVTFGSEFSREWRSSDEETWTQSIEDTLDAEVPARTTLVISSPRATYSSGSQPSVFSVRSSEYSFDEFPLTTGTSGSDTIVGTSNNDFLVGFSASDHVKRPGKGSIDSITGLSGSDIFALGDSSRPYYTGGFFVKHQNTRKELLDDLAVINDFNHNSHDKDRIQLHKSPTLYSLEDGVYHNTRGTYITFNETQREFLTPQRIGFIAGVPAKSLSLQSEHFLFA